MSYNRINKNRFDDINKNENLLEDKNKKSEKKKHQTHKKIQFHDLRHLNEHGKETTILVLYCVLNHWRNDVLVIK